ncbi:MAG: hypothetical protein KA198_07085 [Chitinophagaceae bacterium]|nr:hypothetical protein [Chitinophagaceae bacterium]
MMNVQNRTVLLLVGLSCLAASCAMFKKNEGKVAVQEVKSPNKEDSTARTPTKVAPRNTEKTKVAPRVLEVK